MIHRGVIGAGPGGYAAAFYAADKGKRVLLIEQDKRLSDWYPWIAGELIKRQNQDGSWTSTACISGRTFATACAVMTFLAPQRMLPILEQ